MTENFPIFTKDINLQIQIAEQTTNRIKQKKPTPKHNIVKLLKTKGKKSFNATRKKTTSDLQEKNNSNDSAFLIRKSGVQTEVEQYFPSAKRK